MSITAAAPDTPVSQPGLTSLNRIHQLDVLRGLAVLGIFWVNVIVFALPTYVYSYPTLFSGGHEINIMAWAFNDVFIEGTMRGLFSMLFGASAMIFLDESRKAGSSSEVVDRFYRRNLLLILFGMIHAYLLLWPYDVLYVYGLLGMFLFPLRKLSPRVFLLLGCLLLVFSDIPILSGGHKNTGPDFSSATPMQIADAEQSMRDQLMPDIEDEVQFRHSSYATIFLQQIPEVINQQSTVIYTTNLFDMGGMMLIGIALLKFGVITGSRSTRFYLILALLGYGLGAGSRIIPVYNLLSYDHLSLGVPFFDGIDYTFSRMPIAIGHMSIIMLLCRWRIFDWLTGLLAPIGRIALTSYLLQTTVSIFIFYGFGFGLFGELERYQLVYICLGMWIFHIVFSVLWLRYFYQGPLEWLWRSIIYGQRQPFVKNITQL